MATTLTVTPITRAGVDMAAAMTGADATGNNWATTGTEFLVVTNANGAPITVSLTIVQQVDGQTPPARTVTIPNGKTELIGPISQPYANGSVAGCTWSAATGVTVGVFKAQ